MRLQLPAVLSAVTSPGTMGCTIYPGCVVGCTIYDCAGQSWNWGRTQTATKNEDTGDYSTVYVNTSKIGRAHV